MTNWDTNVYQASGGSRKKRDEDQDGNDAQAIQPGMMKFTLMSRKGNKQQVRVAVVLVLDRKFMINLYRRASWPFQKPQILLCRLVLRNFRIKPNNSSSRS